MRDISNFEVALRNACNAAMESSWQGDTHWLLDENSPARRPVMRKSARGMLDSNPVSYTHLVGTSLVKRVPALVAALRRVAKRAHVHSLCTINPRILAA